jgi:hypothetical protein
VLRYDLRGFDLSEKLRGVVTIEDCRGDGVGRFAWPLRGADTGPFVPLQSPDLRLPLLQTFLQTTGSGR